MTTSCSLVPQNNTIDGNVETPAIDLGEFLTDPDTGEKLQAQLSSSTEQVERAITAATELHRSGVWTRRSVADRVRLLERTAELVEERTAAIAREDSKNNGLPLSISTLFAGGLPDLFRSAATHLKNSSGFEQLPSGAHLHRLAWGPTAVIAPWNAPSFITAKKTAFALAAGAPVIAKPSNWAPSGPNVLAEAISRAIAEVDAPKALFQLVHGGGDVGHLLASDRRIRALAFTGGRAAGSSIAAAASTDFKALQLELGSNNPVIIRADADIDLTAAALVDGFTKLNGQWCESPGSVFVPPHLHDRLVDAILDRTAEIALGRTDDANTTMGPQANEPQRQRMRDTVEFLRGVGGTAVSSTPVPDDSGWFFPPTVVHGISSEQTKSETFGPILTVHRASTDEEALLEANALDTGLAGYVFGADVDAARELATRIDCGENKINSTSLLDLDDHSTQSFWGGSGIGAHGDAELLDFFRGSRIIGVDAPGLPL
ncbi:aldehyde dehydrogenase family protein [Rhodococcus qingshengii]|uniref:aldehyde dehydrogenase family protein n=1 Tax=Rhodococcus qingshengii TaxID=334542 RepID=UPI0033F263A3